MINMIKNRLGSKPCVGGGNTFLNPYSYLMLRREKHLVNHFESIMIDGQFLVYMIHLFLGKKLERRSFDMTSLAPIVFKNASESGDNLFFIGSDANSINRAVERFKLRYPRLQICGWRNGYFRSSMERKDAVNVICQLSPAIVVVGMGTPRQEQFLIELRESGWVGTGFTCGGFFHQTARRIDYYPKWANKCHLRWMYRIIDEPKLIRRYAFDYTCFLMVFLYDILRCKFQKSVLSPKDKWE